MSSEEFSPDRLEELADIESRVVAQSIEHVYQLASEHRQIELSVESGGKINLLNHKIEPALIEINGQLEADQTKYVYGITIRRDRDHTLVAKFQIKDPQNPRTTRVLVLGDEEGAFLAPTANPSQLSAAQMQNILMSAESDIEGRIQSIANPSNS